MPPPRSTQRVRISPLGDTALLAELGSRLDTALNTRASALAAALRKRRDELIAMHTRPIYRVFLVGFVPGWAYLGPLPEELFLPRRKVPRMQVPPGSVAIAGRQTGIYPLPTPGGWHLIGRTSVRLFLPDSDPPCLFRAGD